MTADRILRVNELLRREVAEALFRLMHESGFDMASVTVTNVLASRDLQHARVLVSIRGHVTERQKMLEQMQAHRIEIQSQINRDLRLRYTPRLAFELDPSLEQGDRVLSLLTEMEAAAGDAGEASAAGPETQPEPPAKADDPV
jgi:ribosome-binding factor A